MRLRINRVKYADMEDVTADVNRRFREELARHDIGTETEAARRAGVQQQWLSRRLTGATSWTVTDLQMVCDKLDLSYVYVATGLRESNGAGEEVLDALAEYVARRVQSPLAPPTSGFHPKDPPLLSVPPPGHRAGEAKGRKRSQLAPRTDVPPM